MQITPQVIQDLQQQFSMDYQRGFQKRKTLWQKRAYQAPSSAFQNVYAWLAELPEMRKWVGPRVMNNLVARAYTLPNDDWELSFAIDRKAIEYDQIGIYSQRAEVMGAGASRWKDKLVTDAQIAGNTTKCWDGQNFYDPSHPVNFDDATLGTYSNSFTALPLTTTNIWTVVAGMMAIKGENGIPMEVMPNVLEVPPQLGKVAMDAMNQSLTAQTIQNVAGTENVAAAGVTNTLQGFLELVINPRLAGVANVWYVHSNDTIMPFVLQVAKEPTEMIARLDPTLDSVFHRKQFEFGTDASGAAGYTLPFLSARVVTV